jgi:hypothetical protein
MTKLPFILVNAVRTGHMTREQAERVNAMADGLVACVESGEITEDDALEFSARQALADGAAELAARGRRS